LHCSVLTSSHLNFANISAIHAITTTALLRCGIAAQTGDDVYLLDSRYCESFNGKSRDELLSDGTFVEGDSDRN